LKLSDRSSDFQLQVVTKNGNPLQFDAYSSFLFAKSERR